MLPLFPTRHRSRYRSLCSSRTTLLMSRCFLPTRHQSAYHEYPVSDEIYILFRSYCGCCDEELMHLRSHHHSLLLASGVIKPLIISKNGLEVRDHLHFSFDLVSDIDASSPVEAVAGKLKKPSSSECVCCLSNTATVALVPCGHLCMCTKCLPEISDHLCPLCRQPFVSSLVIFIS